MGGKSTIDLVVVAYCGRSVEDPNLSPFFGNFESRNLLLFHKDIIMTALVQPRSGNEAQAKKNRVILRHYQLIQSGFNENHFDMLVEHFCQALKECFIADDVASSCLICFRALRPIFERKSGLAKASCSSYDTRDTVREQIARVRRQANASAVPKESCRRTS
eukprot:scaffold1366_cov91-Cylindrotheca_fusiformis.AAC.6